MADLVWIRTTVEYPGDSDVAYESMARTKWDAMSELEQEAYLCQAALDHEANCGVGSGGSVIDEVWVPDSYKDVD